MHLRAIGRQFTQMNAYFLVMNSKRCNLAGINKEPYYSALSISPDSNYELHLKRPVDSWFINNYFV